MIRSSNRTRAEWDEYLAQGDIAKGAKSASVTVASLMSVPNTGRASTRVSSWSPSPTFVEPKS